MVQRMFFAAKFVVKGVEQVELKLLQFWHLL